MRRVRPQARVVGAGSRVANVRTVLLALLRHQGDSMTRLVVHDEEWPHGLRCGDCANLLTEGMPYSERLEGMSEVAGEPAAVVLIVCAECAR